MKRIRMDSDAYEDGSVFALTIATSQRRPLFEDPVVTESCLAQLKAAATKYGATVYAYCFMPNHVHLLTSLPGGVSLITFIRHFKQLSGYRFRRLAGYEGETLWQRRFYDHALRREEEMDGAIEYIWSNPLRARLVDDAADYPYSGSLAQDEVSGSEDPDLPRSPPRHRRAVGEGLQTLAPG